MRLLAALVALLALAGPTALAQATAPVLPSALETRARALGAELRCPVCRGLPIGESPSSFAKEMMAELRRRVAGGESDEAIKAFFVARYGEEVLLAPPRRGLGLVIWLGPPLALLLGGLGLVAYLRRASKPVPEADPRLLERVRADLERRGGEA